MFYQDFDGKLVLADGSEGDEHMKNDIVKYLKSNIASYKWPKIVDFAKELPKTISGKVRRVEIKQNDWAEAKSAEQAAKEHEISVNVDVDEKDEPADE